MSMHKIMMSKVELEGLKAHGLSTEKPSQLSDCFRLGVKWSQKEELNAANERIIELERELLRCDTAFKSIKITTGLSKCTTRHNAILRLKINKGLS